MDDLKNAIREAGWFIHSADAQVITLAVPIAKCNFFQVTLPMENISAALEDFINTFDVSEYVLQRYGLGRDRTTRNFRTLYGIEDEIVDKMNTLLNHLKGLK